MRWFSVNPNNSCFISLSWRVKTGFVDSLDSKLQDFWCFLSDVWLHSHSTWHHLCRPPCHWEHTQGQSHGIFAWKNSQAAGNIDSLNATGWLIRPILAIVTFSYAHDCKIWRHNMWSIFVRQCFGLSDLQRQHLTVVLQPDSFHLNPALTCSVPFLPPQSLQG